MMRLGPVARQFAAIVALLLAAQAQAAYNVAIIASGASSGGSWVGNTWTASAGGAQVLASEIEAHLAAGATLIGTGGGGAENGDIAVDGTVDWSANTLTLSAARHININAALNGSGTAGLALEYGQGAVAAGNVSTYKVHAPVNLASTGSFSTQLGSDGAVKNYTILTTLGAAGSSSGIDLQGMNGNKAGNYVLGANIDASATSGWNAGAGFVPVGASAANFSGSFDGLGHTVSDLYINRPATDYVGLFGSTATGVTLRNVGLLNANVTGRSMVGALLGEGFGTTVIDNSYATGTVSGNVEGDYQSVGGLAGTVSTINDSHAAVTVSGGTYTGGLVGISSAGGINRSYATGNVSGFSSAGGLVGTTNSAISDSYATGAVTASVASAGGLVGDLYGGTITNSYATGAVSASGGNAGGLVGQLFNGATVTASFWDTQTSGQATSAAGTGKTTAEMKSLATFAGWDIDDAGGTGKVWRIYDGYTNPLLRGFMTALNVQPDYDGSGAALTNVGAATVIGAHDAGKVFTGSLFTDTLTLSSTAADAYTATSTANNLYSNQQGYDLMSVARSIATPGSASGDIALTNPISWTSGTLAINTTGTITDTAAINGTGTAIFDLQAGTWNQVNAALPGFAAYDFRISDGTFIRALSGDGAVGTPYQLADIHGMQGMGSSGMLGLNYALANDVDAGGTANWNAGAGFVPVGDVATKFTGGFDGLGHTISGLYINRPGTSYVGLFGFTETDATLRNIGLLNANVTGSSSVGALLGVGNGNAVIDNSYATGTVSGVGAGGSVGGLAGNVSTINDSHAAVTVSGLTYTGGLVGISGAGGINRSYATGNVSGTGNYFGGLVGFQGDGSISNSYATGSVGGTSYVGGLVGYSNYASASIAASYATGAITGSGNYVGGLAGHYRGTIANSYATGSSVGTSYVGGLVGWGMGASASITNSYATGAVTASVDGAGGLVGQLTDGATVTASYWDTFTTGQATSAGGVGKTTTEMKSLATFSGWDIDDAGGTGKVWRIYDGYTNPLLRGFMTTLNAQPDYDGSGAALGSIAAYTLGGAYDTGKVLGAAGSTLTLTSTAADAYTATVKGLYSTQQGYDLVLHRSISTPGSASGDIALSNPISWTSGTLAINTAGTITQTAAVNGSGTAIFDLQGGTWRQVAATLPGFVAYDFRISGGSLVRALSGDGTVGTPYQLADIYGMQGMGSSGIRGLNYALANDVDAGGTANWNAGAGFVPVGNLATKFTGSFDGLGHTVTGLFINRPVDIAANNYQGLFGYSTGSLSNIGLIDSNISGANFVGALAGRSDGAISNSYADGGSVSASAHEAGGLVGALGGGSIGNSYANVSVTGTTCCSGVILSSAMGGLVGKTLGGNISNSYATGSVNGGSIVGGLVGLSDAIIDTSYASGSVTSVDGSSGGGFIGELLGGTITNSYWDSATTTKASRIGAPNSGNVVSLTDIAAAPYAQASYTGFDFAGSWRIYEGNTRPLLKSFLTPLTVTANDASKTYDGLPYSGGNGVTYSSVPNGNLLGAISYGGTSQGATIAGSYAIAAGGLYSNQRGYDIAYVAGTLNITALPTTYGGPTVTGTGGATATVAGGGPTCGFSHAQFIDVTAVPTPPPAGLSFPHGLFDFTLDGCTPAGTVTVTVTYPQALSAGTQYWKYGPTPDEAAPHWYVMPAVIAGNTATFSITDGGLGDDDLTANGVIVDQGGPGNELAPVPALSFWSLLLLSPLLAGLGRRTIFNQRKS